MQTRTAQGSKREKANGLPVTDRAGRAIGRLIGREYHKLVSRPDQILRSPPGFGFDVWALDAIVLPRVDAIVVEDKVNGRRYRSTAENFRMHRIQINRGAGPQYVLPLVYWEAEELRPTGAKSTPLMVEPTPAAPPPAPRMGVPQPRLL